MAVSLTINDRTTDATRGRSLYDCAEQLGLRVPTSCRKNGKCKECVIEVTAGIDLLTARTEHEQHLNGKFRLSCQCSVTAEVGDVKCHTTRREQMHFERRPLRLPTSGSPMPLDPAVTRDGDRILIDAVEVARSTGPIHGIAMDLGTTTVAIRLINLETGELVADASFENPQRFGGSDAMSRIQYDLKHRGLLMRTLAGYITQTLEEMPVDLKTVYEMVVVGNPAMRDIFFRHSVYSIGQSPYQSISEIELNEGKRATTAIISTGRRCLLPIHPKARVYGVPLIGGHLGADAAACMLAIDLAHEGRLVALMDIGTNTELILGNKDRVLAASCPAFEGGVIACAMPGVDGAIEEIRFEEDGSVTLGVIGDGRPQGICGSGLVDLLSELLRTGRMNESGRFQHGGDRMQLDAAGDILVLEGDLKQLAEAKGVNVARLRVLFDAFGISFDDIDVFYLAGGLGPLLRIDASRRIGLIPDLPDSKIVQIGNAAIEGACIALLSQSKRRELEALVRKVERCRAETHLGFADFLADGCQFKRLQSSLRTYAPRTP